jgi:hypothetical protein
MRYAFVCAGLAIPLAMLASGAERTRTSVSVPLPPRFKVNIEVTCGPTIDSTGNVVNVTVNPWHLGIGGKSLGEIDFYDKSGDASVYIEVHPHTPGKWPYTDPTGGVFKNRKHPSGTMTAPKLRTVYLYHIRGTCTSGGSPIAFDIDPDVTIDPAVSGSFSIMSSPASAKPSAAKPSPAKADTKQLPAKKPPVQR